MLQALRARRAGPSTRPRTATTWPPQRSCGRNGAEVAARSGQVRRKGEATLKVAVVTPYYKEPIEVLRRCHDSVAAQTAACTHFMVADGHPNAEAAQWDVEHFTLPKAHADYGNTPRCIGAISALNLGFEGIAFLDADNWYAPEHVESLINTHQTTGAAVALADRHIVLPNGQVLPPEIQEDVHRTHADTSCFFFTAKAAALIPVWAMMDKPLGPICDRVMFHAMKARGLSFAWTNQRTLFYESRYAVHFQQAGLEPPPDVHFVDFKKMKALFSNARNTERVGYDLGIGIT